MSQAPEKRLDAQQVEFIARNRLIDELLRADLEVALPMRDRGIDLIAYADLSSTVSRYSALPIQIKSAWSRSFVIDRKYERIRGLIMAYVWHLDDSVRAVTYAMTYEEGVKIGDAMGWTQTPSWARGMYSTSAPSAKLVSLLEPYRMDSGRWWTLVTAAA